MGFANTDTHSEEHNFSKLLLPKYLYVKTLFFFFFIQYSVRLTVCQVRDMQIATAET